MNHEPLNIVMTETVTVTLDDHEEVVVVVDNDAPPTPVSLTPPNDTQENDVYISLLIPVPSSLPSQSLISPPATIITVTIPSEQPIVSSTSLDLLSVVSQASQDPDGNSPVIIAANAAAVTRSSNLGLSITPSIPSRDPAGSIAGSIEEKVER